MNRENPDSESSSMKNENGEHLITGLSQEKLICSFAIACFDSLRSIASALSSLGFPLVLLRVFIYKTS